MFIKRDNISLRAMEPADIELLYKWENDQRLWYLSNTLTPFSKYDLQQFIVNSHNDIFTDKQLRLMIDHHQDDQVTPIGCIDLFEFIPSYRRAGIGILIDESVRQCGFASQALDLLIDYVFNTLNLHQLFCNILTTNEKSLNLFRSKNFEITGTKKDWVILEGQWQNEYLLQLINPDMKA